MDASAEAGFTQDSPWPQGCQGAVSLTFDDNTRTQLEIAVPILERFGLRGTFYVVPGGAADVWRAKLEPWRAVVLAGHEIGNHSLTHPCGRNFEFDPSGRGLEDQTLATIEADVSEAQRRLSRTFPEQNANTFCYPCYQDYVGMGLRRQSYVPVIAKYFPAARGRGERANHPLHSDLHYLSSFPAERCSGATMIGVAEQAASDGRWAIFTFHGIQGDHLSVAEADFTALCAHLARQRSRLWTAPVVTIAQRVGVWREAQPAR